MSSAPTRINPTSGGGGGTDQLVKVTASDTVAGYLSGKLVIHPDTPIAVNILSPGADEDMQLELDGDQVMIDWVPSNYTRNAAIAEATDVTDLSAHLKGIDDLIGVISADSGLVLVSVADTVHESLQDTIAFATDTPISTSIQNPGFNEQLLFTLDGDKVDISWEPSSYVPNASIAEADDVDDLSAHLKGIDDALQDASDLERIFSLEKMWRVALVNSYKEFTYTGTDLTQVDVWETSGKITKLFTRVLNYTGVNLTSAVTTNNVTTAVLTSTLTYVAGNLDTVTKTIT